MTSAKQFDLPAFKAFVAGKDPDETYNPGSTKTCALAQAGFPGVTLLDCKTLGIPVRVYGAAISNATFGALHSRLNNLPADPPAAAKEGGDDSPVSALTPLDGERA